MNGKNHGNHDMFKVSSFDSYTLGKYNIFLAKLISSLAGNGLVSMSAKFFFPETLAIRIIPDAMDSRTR
jgi:hypothetical protein